MHITDHMMTHKFADTLYTLTNDCRAKMSDMQRLCDIGSAVIYDNGLRIIRLVTSESALIFLHGSYHRSKVVLAQFQIDKSGLNGFYALKHSVIL